MTKLNQEYLQKFFHYDPDTGVFTRIKRLSWKGNEIPCHRVSKKKGTRGYIEVNIGDGKHDGRRPHSIHRLIFIYMLGEMPIADVDHINGDRTDNRWCNLRMVNHQDNLRNMGIRNDNSSGQIGVSYSKGKKKWYACISVGGSKSVSLGFFANLEDAIAARLNAEQTLGYHENHGKRPAWGG